ncbi:MAG: aspartate/glutamate racemase family protein, partial [Anaerolineales bacterium]|nr:aspartate/glutamate racemase family protein [Anaerolineales bacterium]
MDFYKGRLTDQHGLHVLIPPEAPRQQVHHIIYDELCLGQILPSSKATYQAIIADLVTAGAEGVILGCTEIGLLIKEGDTAVPIFDTTYLHAATAVDFALTP